MTVRAEIDFVTALGRLLRSGALRDEFAADPARVAEQVGLRAGDRAAWGQLVPAELEAQAEVLLKKRFVAVRRVLPRTCRALGGDGEDVVDGKKGDHGKKGEEAWRVFRGYARGCWPGEENKVADDARGFCAALRRVRPEAVCGIEAHRAQWLCDGSRWSVRWLAAVPFRKGFRPGVQIFLRWRGARWHEWVVYAGL